MNGSFSLRRNSTGLWARLRLRRRSDRAAIIAYGGWIVIAFLMLFGTWLSLESAEYTARYVVLGQAESGAAALEQTTLRLFETINTLENLAQARIRLSHDGDHQVAAFIELQMQQAVDSSHLGIHAVSIVDGDGSIAWSSRNEAGAGNFDASVLVGRRDVDDGHAIIIPPNARAGRTPTFLILRPLLDLAGHRSATMVVSVDALNLSSVIAEHTEGGISVIQQRESGAILARSDKPQLAFSERVSPNDPILRQAQDHTSGRVEIHLGDKDLLVGWRAPPEASVIVSQIYDANQALADFFHLRQIVLSVVFALAVGALIATRLVLANFLLRQTLAEQAMLDPLTGLYNRRYFAEIMNGRVETAQHGGASAAVLVIDLDGFKQVNDTRGHPIGDKLLQHVAHRLLRCVGTQDTVLRLGGDEFAIVRIGRLQRRDVTTLARILVDELANAFEIGGYHLHIAGSIGIAMPPEGGSDLNDLLRSADIALYCIKAQGGSAYQMFDPDMEESVRTRRALEMDLRDALERNELELFFQPLVQLDPRRVSGFESLMRWHHPVAGMIMPGRFISIAEETGMIAEIGAWAIRRACEEAATWPDGTRIAVNLSPVQFARSDLVQIVGAALRETRLPPHRLELEITEGVVMNDNRETLATMRQLKALGVRLALDDFGTGYASLSYLRSFPFDKIKIDGSFLADLDGDGGTIVRAMLSLCAHLGLDTLVECVETTAQLEWLRREGCTEVQGHWFSPPKPGGKVIDMIERINTMGESVA